MPACARSHTPSVLLLCALASAACHGAPATDDTDASVTTPNPITADADWIRDPDGRVALLRGANYSALEFGNFIASEDGPREADFEQLASWGVNAIRLPISWQYLEPTENQLDEAYLTDQVDPVIAFAAAHGIAVVIDMHQYLWSPCVGGLGAPAWTCEGHSYPQGGAGSSLAACDFFAVEGDPRSPSVGSDGRLLRDHFLDVWRLVARHYANDPRVVAWDYFNEPLAVCLSLAGHSFELDVLNPFYRRIREIAEEEHAGRMFFYEPPLTRSVGAAPTLEDLGPDVVYSPHLYGDQTGLPYDGDRAALSANYAQAVGEAATLGGPLVVGEFGGNADGGPGYLEATESFLRDSFDELDRRLSSGFFWAYFPGDNGFNVVTPDGADKGELVNSLARPYAQRIAGTPTAMSFDPTTKAFHLGFDDDAAHPTSAPTEIFVPAARQYPDGFTVEVTAGDRWEVSESGTTVRVFAGDATTHDVRITASAPR